MLFNSYYQTNVCHVASYTTQNRSGNKPNDNFINNAVEFINSVFLKVGGAAPLWVLEHIRALCCQVKVEGVE